MPGDVRRIIGYEVERAYVEGCNAGGNGVADAILAALAAAGLAVVPVEPTPRMVDEAVEAWHARDGLLDTQLRRIYRAMLAAAQEDRA